MKTPYYIAILLCLFGYSQVNAACDGELGSVHGEGMVNASDPQQIPTLNWLYKDFSSVTRHPEDADPGPGPGGENCEFGIQISGRDGMNLDSAYYSKTHSDPNEIRFRFILDTENLMQSFVTDDIMVLYHFMYKYQGLEDKFLKIRLKKKDFVSSNYDWELKLQWFGSAIGESVHQSFYFKETDNFVEIEFFWNRIDALNNNRVLLFSKSQAGVIFKAGSGVNNKPVFMISPYDYLLQLDYVGSILEGTSVLGYINSNNSPAQEGDEIRIISPNLYSN